MDLWSRKPETSNSHMISVPWLLCLGFPGFM
jgi:hypothetical protein